jgi:hypothetical protein
MQKKVTISNRLNVLDFFKNMKNYVIMRIDEEFPSYKYSDDIDILTNDLEGIKEHIMKVGEKYNDFKIKISNGSGGKTHYHIDFYYKNETIDDFRFDVISDLNRFYKSLNIPNDYIENVLKNKIIKNVNGVNVYIPKLSNELELRYMEYKTKIDRKPKKIKHLRFIEKYPNVTFKKY